MNISETPRRGIALTHSADVIHLFVSCCICEWVLFGLSFVVEKYAPGWLSAHWPSSDMAFNIPALLVLGFAVDSLIALLVVGNMRAATFVGRLFLALGTPSRWWAHLFARFSPIVILANIALSVGVLLPLCALQLAHSNAYWILALLIPLGMGLALGAGSRGYGNQYFSQAPASGIGAFILGSILLIFAGFASLILIAIAGFAGGMFTFSIRALCRDHHWVDLGNNLGAVGWYLWVVLTVWLPNTLENISRRVGASTGKAWGRWGVMQILSLPFGLL